MPYTDRQLLVGNPPARHFLNWQQDPFGNFLARLVIPDSTELFRVEVNLTADLTVINPFDFFIEDYAEDFPFAYPAELAKDLQPFLECQPCGPLFDNYLKSIDCRRRRTTAFLVDLNQRLWRDVRYVIRMQPGVQTARETLETSSGSCRDSAWLLVQLLRRLGLAARFVSGYLVQLKSDQKSLDGPSGPEHDFTDLHAWCEVYLPGTAGWDSIQRPACSPAKDICPWRRLRPRRPPRRSPAPWNNVSRNFALRCR